MKGWDQQKADGQSQLRWPGSVKAGAAWHYLPLRGLDWGRRGNGTTELLWWSSLSQWLSLGLFLDDCSWIVWNLSDRTDDGASPCWDCLEDIKWINVGVAACSRVVSWLSSQYVVWDIICTPRGWEEWLVLRFALVREAEFTVLLPGAMAQSQSHHPVCQSWTGVSWKRTPRTSLGILSGWETLLSKDFFCSVTIVPCQNSKWSYLVAVVAW